jgi:hypothetical protein
MFNLNKITRILMVEAEAPAATVQISPAVFNPTEVQQGVGLLDQAAPVDMKAEAQAKQAAEEATGSVSVDEPVVDKVVEGEQVAAKTVEVAENGSEESVAVPTDAVVTGDYIYKGVAVEVTNTPEMEAAFTEKELDIDAVNKELYSEAGLTDATREKLNEAFGKLSVDMYLQGMDARNEAMHQTHTNNQAALDASMDKLTAEVTGGKMTEVMAWANTNLQPDEYKKYADAINGTDEFAVKMALQDLTSKSGLISSALVAPIIKERPEATLLDGANPESTGVGDMITAAEYRAAIVSGEYAKDMKSWDTRRQAGLDANY